MKKLILLLAFCLAFAASYAQQVLWEHTLGSLNKIAYRYVTLPDGGYAAIFNEGNFASITRFDSLGNTVWSEPFDSDLRLSPDWRGGMLKVVPGGLLAGLQQYSPDTTRLVLVKVGWQGAMLWRKVVPTGRSITYATDLHIRAPNEYLLLAQGENDNQALSAGAGHKFLMLSLDSLCNTRWRKLYTDPLGTIDYTRNIFPYRNNGYMLSGGGGVAPGYVRLIKTDEEGNSLDNQMLSDVAAPNGYRTELGNFILSSDGSIVFTGYHSGTWANRFILVTKVDTAFNTLWTITHHEPGNHFNTSNVIEMANGNILVVTQQHLNDKVILLTLSPQGQKLDTAYVPVANTTHAGGLVNSFLLPDSSLFYGAIFSMAKIGNVGLPMQQLVANAGLNDSVCANAAPFTLSGYSPSGGIWSGTGVSAAGVFTPGASLAGTHTLTYTVTSGSQTATATKTVTVHALPVAEFTYTLSGNQAVFSNASTAAATYIWSFGDGGTSALPNPSHTYSGSGTYTVTLTAITAEGCTATTTQTILLTATANLLEQAIKLYPNPTQGILVIERTDEGTGPILVEVYSTQGQLVKRAVLSARQAQVDLGNLAGGVYQVKLLTGQAVVHRQVVLMK